MRARVVRGDVTFHRPFLDAARTDLRAALQAQGIGWAEDPTNADTRFARARVRQALSGLDLDIAQVAQTAARLAEARAALGVCAEAAARPLLRFEAGDPVIARDGWLSLPTEIRRRILRAALLHVAGAGYGPRGAEMQRLLDALANGQDATLAGCRVLCHKAEILVIREVAAIADLRAPPDAVWDGRWRLEGPEDHGAAPLYIAALGEAGLALCPDRKSTGHPAARLIASPAIWQDGRLIAAPLAGLEAGWSARPLRGTAHFFERLRAG
jgi:tRNA(Ile)-lysidine synthase